MVPPDGPFGVDVDPLTIVSGVGELTDPLLGHLHPLGRTEFAALRRGELV